MSLPKAYCFCEPTSKVFGLDTDHIYRIITLMYVSTLKSRDGAEMAQGRPHKHKINPLSSIFFLRFRDVVHVANRGNIVSGI